jgi:hypothetical protein
VGAVQRHPEQVFGLLCRRPMLPPARQIGDARHVGEGDNATVGDADAGRALSLEREPAIGLGMRRAPGAEASASRARVRRSLPPRSYARNCLPPLAPHFPRTCARVQDALWGVRKLVGVSVNAMDSLTPTQRSAHMSGFAARTRNPGSMRWPALRCWPRSSRRSGCVRRRPRWRQGSARRLIGGGGGRGRSLFG